MPSLMMMTSIVSEESLTRDRQTDTQTDRHTDRQTDRHTDTQLFIYLFKAYRPVNRTGSPQGFSQVQNLAQVEYNTKHAYYINVKRTNIIRKLVPPVLLL